MTDLMRFLLFVFTLVLGPSALASEKSPLTLGVFPYVTPAQLAAFHAPLKDYLARGLDRPVTLVTAPDFMSFVDRTRDGQYDIVFTAPHLGRLAETRDGYKRVAQTSHTVQGFFLARKDSDIRKIEDLRGKTVMIAQKVSIVYQMAEHTLRENGLVPGESVTIIDTRTHNNAMHAPLRGEADASVTGKLLWYVLDDKQKEPLQIIGTTEEAPGFLVMAHPRLATQDVDKIKNLLLAFHLKPGSASYFTTNGYEKFQAVDDRTMKGLDPYTRIFLKPTSP
ncbi:MAG: phosphate/phosphite/phosphonate ABC transporter substrate-binding protein [Gammaproteobacteria bacterium]|nr:phosphate/phosphite/phosphonate ABC transporter substrate-binding protein [Gammaproteobacteria bacterium]MBU1408014.1 phosphate/phosphite/phosphonate ABC transporter substrate-binding protein [Gammaproteobacteria bacterium]